MSDVQPSFDEEHTPKVELKLSLPLGDMNFLILILLVLWLSMQV